MVQHTQPHATLELRRTPGEIVAKVADIESRGDDPLGWHAVLIGSLSFKEAQQFLLEGVTQEAWKVATSQPFSDEATEYLAFAFDKARNHRGLSASRSVYKMTEYAWLAGADDVVERMEAAPYAQYGVPKLVEFAVAFLLPIPDDKVIENMAAGQPCRPDCEDGCAL